MSEIIDAAKPTLTTFPEAGALDVALRNVNYFYTRDVRESVDKALKLLEPTITMGLGIVMALIMWSVLSPVYDILGKLKL